MQFIHLVDNAVHVFVVSIRTHGLTAFFTNITKLGDIRIILVLLVFLTIILSIRKRSYIIPLWITVIVAEAVTFFGKILIHRPRPLGGLLTETDFSFPSGHATIAVAVYGFIIFILLKQPFSPHKKIAISLLSVMLILLIGFSRLYLGVHYFSDVIAGFAVGAFGLFVGIRLFNYFMKNSSK